MVMKQVKGMDKIMNDKENTEDFYGDKKRFQNPVKMAKQEAIH